jgi:serine/threonine protein kinase
MMVRAALQEIEQDTRTPSERRLLQRAVGERYRVGELLSRGGMGGVYRAFEPGLERDVALKVLASERAADPDERGRFRREARILASFSHPGIVAVLAMGESPVAWYAMPFERGGTLAARLEGGARRSADETQRLMLRLADALAHAHARGVVHRDVKAENVLLDEAGEGVLADFGVAIDRTSDHSRSDVQSPYGTPEYMAPELFAGTLECDGRQDLYSLGVLGFRMLTGRFPFEGNARQIAAAHLTREAPTVTAYAANVPEYLAAAIDRCLRREPGRRWPDAAELAGALRARTGRTFVGRLVSYFEA